MVCFASLHDCWIEQTYTFGPDVFAVRGLSAHRWLLRYDPPLEPIWIRDMLSVCHIWIIAQLLRIFANICSTALNLAYFYENYRKTSRKILNLIYVSFPYIMS